MQHWNRFLLLSLLTGSSMLAFMKLFEIGTDSGEQYSYFVPQEPADAYYKFCEHCNWELHPISRKKVLKWQGGKEADFMSGIFGTFARAHVSQELQRQFPDLQIKPVTVTNDANSEGRGLKYRGEEIVELVSDLRVQLDPARSTLLPERRFAPCPVCRRTVGYLEGVEERALHYVNNQSRFRRNAMQRAPRLPGKGAFLYEDELGSANFFFLGGSISLHCTERVRDFMLQHDYSNADLVEIGETVTRGQSIPIKFDM